jgi:hypothetical protein
MNKDGAKIKKEILRRHLQTSTRSFCEIAVLHLQLADDKKGGGLRMKCQKNSFVPI